MQANGSLVVAESGGGKTRPAIWTSALAAKLSWWASHHGAVFAIRVRNMETIRALRYKFDK